MIKMVNMKKLIIIPIIILTFGVFAYSNDARAPEWMNYTIGARAVALGQAFAAFADDATTAFNNPAGLSNIIRDEDGHRWWISGTFGLMPDKRYLGAFSTSTKFKKLAVGISGIYTNGMDLLNADRNPADSQRDYAFMPIISLGSVLPDNETIAFGGNIKFFKSKTDNIKASGFAFDIGGYIAVINMISIGVFVKNIGYIKYEDRDSRFIAPTVSAGIGYNPLSRRNFAFCIHIERDTGSSNAKFIGSGGLFIALWTQDYMTGVSSDSPVDETPASRKRTIYHNAIHLNLGFHGKEFSCGLTFSLFGFKLDYAFVIHTTEKNKYSHLFTLEKRF